jgi:putative SOS response-associated peptidase YedK
MCGRYAATLPPEMMVELFNLLNSVDIEPRYNIKPTDPIVAIRNSRSQGGRVAGLYRWGLIPSFVKDPKAMKVLINARAEGIVDKPAFRNAMKWGRAIIPADGYYEWMVGSDGQKRPYYIRSAENAPMAFAGLISNWKDAEGNVTPSATIVTVDPNLDISDVHDRMPAVLRGEAIDKWLDTEHVGPVEAAALAEAPPPGTMRYHAVTREVGKVDAEGPDLVRPLTPEEIEAQTAAMAKPKRKKAAGGGQLDLF